MDNSPVGLLTDQFAKLTDPRTGHAKRHKLNYVFGGSWGLLCGGEASRSECLATGFDSSPTHCRVKLRLVVRHVCIVGR